MQPVQLMQLLLFHVATCEAARSNMCLAKSPGCSMAVHGSVKVGGLRWISNHHHQ